MNHYSESVEDRILAPLTGSSRPFWIWVGVLLAIILDRVSKPTLQSHTQRDEI